MKNLMKKVFAVALTLVCLFTTIGCTQKKPDETLTNAQYALALGAVADVCAVGMPEPAPAIFSAIPESDFESSIERTDIVPACAWFMRFLQNIVNTEGIVITEDYFEGTIDGLGTRIKLNYKNNDKKIYAEVFICSPGEYYCYLSCDVKYDFKKNELGHFEMRLLNAMQIDKDQTFYFRYKNNALKVLSKTSSQYDAISTEIYNQTLVQSQMPFGENLPDFSEQYHLAEPK